MIKKGILILFGIYMVLLIGFYFVQERIIFQSKKLNKDFVYSVHKDFEEVNLNTKDNSNINALHFKVNEPKGAILYFHGNKGNLQRWADMVLPLTDYGYDLFVIDYRGYGKSTGKRSEEALYNDAQLAYDHLKKSYKEDELVIYGRSMGATFATYVASQNEPKQLILEAPFHSLIGAISSNFLVLPFNALLKYKFKSHEFIPKVKSPTVIFHGNKDKLIPLRSGRKLFEASNNSITEFILIENGTHHNLSLSETYKEKIKSLLN